MPTHSKTAGSFLKKFDQYIREDCSEPPLVESPIIKELLGDVKSRAVLCIGCGTGAECHTFSSLGANVEGMDSSQALVDFAKGSHPKLSFRCGSVEALPYSVGQFDLVYCAHVLHYFKEWDRALNEIRRVLAPTGKVVITIHHPADQGYAGDEPLEVHATWYDNFEVVFYPRSIKSMRDAFEKAGLEVLKVVEMNGEEGKPPLIAAFELRKPGLFEPVNNFV